MDKRGTATFMNHTVGMTANVAVWTKLLLPNQAWLPRCKLPDSPPESKSHVSHGVGLIGNPAMPLSKLEWSCMERKLDTAASSPCLHRHTGPDTPLPSYYSKRLTTSLVEESFDQHHRANRHYYRSAVLGIHPRTTSSAGEERQELGAIFGLMFSVYPCGSCRQYRTTISQANIDKQYDCNFMRWVNGTDNGSRIMFSITSLTLFNLLVFPESSYILHSLSGSSRN